MEIIALSGYARSGKDEAAKVLVEEYGFTRLAFADKLREFLYALNPLVYPSFNQYGDHNGFIYVQDVIDKYGWDGYKETHFGPEIRRLLQRLGTEAGRNTLWDSIWIDAAFANVPADGRIVVSDSRFLNEFDAITNRGGRILRIERKGVGPANNHSSELEALQYDFPTIIYNDGTLEEYREKIRSFANEAGL